MDCFSVDLQPTFVYLSISFLLDTKIVDIDCFSLVLV